MGLGMLLSYEQTGFANVSCIEGCTCRTVRLDLRHENRVSMTFWKSLSVTPAGSSCLLEIVNTSTDQARLKVKVRFSVQPGAAMGLHVHSTLLTIWQHADLLMWLCRSRQSWSHRRLSCGATHTMAQSNSNDFSAS